MKDLARQLAHDLGVQKGRDEGKELLKWVIGPTRERLINEAKAGAKTLQVTAVEHRALTAYFCWDKSEDTARFLGRPLVIRE